MSFSKLSNKPLQIGDKIKLIGKTYNSNWLGIVKYTSEFVVTMIKPDIEYSSIEPGSTSFFSDISPEYEGVYWIRVNDTAKRNYQPSWL